MKKCNLINYWFVGVISITLISCGNEEKATSKEEVKEPTENKEEELITEPIVTTPDYSADFERLKEAIINKDIRGVGAFASSDAIDSEVIIELFTAPDFLNQLKKMSYKDITITENEWGETLELRVFVNGADEEGNEYESGLYLYLSKGENGLLLDNFLAAG